MNNVYDKVRVFYEEELTFEPIIQRTWVEGFLRQNAWQGKTDKQLSKLWTYINLFEQFLDMTGLSRLDELTRYEYNYAVWWLMVYSDFKRSLKNVRAFFEALISFFDYLEGKNIISSAEELKEAAKYISSGSKLKFYDEDSIHLPVPSHLVNSIDTDEDDKGINNDLDGLLHKLAEFYQQPEFNADFQRALSFFIGPIGTIMPDDEYEQAEFWLCFWDYFLFDYKLLSNDKSPIRHYKDLFNENYSAKEQEFLSSLSKTRFIVFYVNNIVDNDWVNCTNLFTNETFYLPNPGYDYSRIKKLLFLGHIFSDTMVLVNYVTSIEVSTKLRKRIHDEIEKQKQIFGVQMPNATWEDFFYRHSITVRHTIQVFTNFNKVNVTPINQLYRSYPTIENKVEVDERVVKLINNSMRKFGFSMHDIELAKKMWYDYNQLTQIKLRKPESWAAAIIYTFSHINLYKGLPADDFANYFHVSTNNIYALRKKIFETLELTKYDPRYLNEEGFMFSIFQ